MPILTKLYSMAEASEHSTKEDCWVVIDGKVYPYTYLHLVFRFGLNFPPTSLGFEI